LHKKDFPTITNRKNKGNQTKGSKSEKQEDMMVSDERKVRKVKRENKYNIK
jgi:hypothetical protein